MSVGIDFAQYGAILRQQQIDSRKIKRQQIAGRQRQGFFLQSDTVFAGTAASGNIGPEVTFMVHSFHGSNHLTSYNVDPQILSCAFFDETLKQQGLTGKFIEDRCSFRQVLRQKHLVSKGAAAGLYHKGETQALSRILQKVNTCKANISVGSRADEGCGQRQPAVF